MNIKANRWSRFRPRDEEMIAIDREMFGGEGITITYRNGADGTITEVWEHGKIIRRIHMCC